MAYNSYFSNNSGNTKVAAATTGNTTGAGGKGGYRSFYGTNVQSAPTADDLAAKRKKKQQDDQVAQAQKQQQQQQAAQEKNSNSVFNKVKRVVGDNIVKPVVDTGQKSINTVAAPVAGVVGAATAGAQALKGDKAGAKRTLAATNKQIDQIANKGIGGKGAYLNSKQASSSGGGLKSLKKNFIEPTSQGVADIAPLVVPVGKGAEAASLFTKVVRGAAENTAISGGTQIANEAVHGTLTKSNGKDLARSLALGAVVGAAVPALGHGSSQTGKAISDIMSKVKAPKSLIEKAKTQALIEKAQKADTEKAVVKAADIDKKVQLIEAKKADGKYTNVDKVKVQQLKAEKESLVKPAMQETPVTSAVDNTSVVAPSVIDSPKPADVTPPKTTQGSLLKKTTTRPAIKITDEPVGTRTLKPSETAHMEEIGGYTHSKDLVKDYADTLRGQDQATKGGQMVPDGSGGYKRTSENSKFYREFYRENKKAPTKADYTEEAQRQLASGRDGFGAGSDYKKLLEREAKPVSRVEVTPSEQDVPRGKSKVGKSVLENAVQKSLKNKYDDVAGYDRITIADQAKKAVAVTEDRPQLDKIISGEAPLPGGLRATALIDAIERHPELGKDTDLLLKLSKSPLASESSYSAQELRLAAERVENSPIEAMKLVRSAREARVERQLKKTPAKAANDEIRAIQRATPKVSKETWGSFVDSLKC